MTLFEFRYFFEHELLPQSFFDDIDTFLEVLLGEEDEENPLFDLAFAVADKEQAPFPYSKEQYRLDIERIKDEDYMLKITLPEPEESPLCSHIYFLLSKDFTNKKCFTVELLEIRKRRKHYCLCEWSETGHHNHGICPSNTKMVEQQIVDIYLHDREAMISLLRK